MSQITITTEQAKSIGQMAAAFSSHTHTTLDVNYTTGVVTMTVALGTDPIYEAHVAKDGTAAKAVTPLG